MDAKKIFENAKSFAVIGASANPHKFGNIIYQTLLNKYLNVYPVNNKYDELLGNNCYKSIDALPEKVDLLIFVVPPAISKQITLRALELGYQKFWYQPGSYDESVLELHRNKNTIVIHQDCLLQLN